MIKEGRTVGMMDGMVGEVEMEERGQEDSTGKVMK
jgi:hypothetical protein